MEDSKIWTSVQLRINNVKLCIYTTDNLTSRLGVLKYSSGYLEIEFGSKDESNIFWDEIYFLMYCDYKTFKEEYGDDLREKDLKIEETFKTIKRLIKKAYKLNILTKK